MIVRKLDLYECLQMERRGAQKGFLHTYRHEENAEMRPKLRPAMLIFPGGGYGYVSAREWEPVAMEYYRDGFDCFVLDYDIAPQHHYPIMLLQAGMAMLYLRSSSKGLSLREDKIAVIGFSAGGHLAGCISFLWEDPALRAQFGEECTQIRPDIAILSYPVVSSEKAIMHEGSFVNFCGGLVSPEDYSLEKHVPPTAPPVFLWGTTEDTCVPIENSVLLYQALHRAGVPTELHIFGRGPHGLSVCDREVTEVMTADVLHASHWVELSLEFLHSFDFYAKERTR